MEIEIYFGTEYVFNKMEINGNVLSFFTNPQILMLKWPYPLENQALSEAYHAAARCVVNLESEINRQLFYGKNPPLPTYNTIHGEGDADMLDKHSTLHLSPLDTLAQSGGGYFHWHIELPQEITLPKIRAIFKAMLKVPPILHGCENTCVRNIDWERANELYKEIKKKIDGGCVAIKVGAGTYPSYADLCKNEGEGARVSLSQKQVDRIDQNFNASFHNPSLNHLYSYTAEDIFPCKPSMLSEKTEFRKLLFFPSPQEKGYLRGRDLPFQKSDYQFLMRAGSEIAIVLAFLLLALRYLSKAPKANNEHVSIRP